MLSIKENIENVFIINKSKFITNIFRIDDINNINKYIESIKHKYKEATHYCYAYIIDNNKKFNDDKEPNGTAGKPILDALEKNKLNHILCIVTRYFGGIKLGTNGLIRAYSKSTSECIKKSNIINLIDGLNVELVFNYNVEKKVNEIINYVIDKKYEEKITYNALIKKEDINLLKDITDIKIIEETYIED
jgi:uncharacterized YigZ family protein